MRKRVLWVGFIGMLAIIALMTASCKKTELELSWESLWGSGSYSSQNNTSTIQMGGWLKFYQNSLNTELVMARLVDWKFLVLEGGRVLFEVEKGNYNQVIENAFINESSLDDGNLWIYLEAVPAILGDIYNGANPDGLQLQVVVQDEQGVTYDLIGDGTFTFTRN